MENQIDIFKELGTYFEPNTQLKKDIIKINKRMGKRDDIEPLEEILNHLSILSKYDRAEVSEALKLVLSFSKEPGTNQSDVHQLLSQIIDEL